MTMMNKIYLFKTVFLARFNLINVSKPWEIYTLAPFKFPQTRKVQCLLDRGNARNGFPGDRITLTFTHIELEDTTHQDGNCTYDYIQVI